MRCQTLRFNMSYNHATDDIVCYHPINKVLNIPFITAAIPV